MSDPRSQQTENIRIVAQVQYDLRNTQQHAFNGLHNFNERTAVTRLMGIAALPSLLVTLGGVPIQSDMSAASSGTARFGHVLRCFIKNIMWLGGPYGRL